LVMRDQGPMRCNGSHAIIMVRSCVALLHEEICIPTCKISGHSKKNSYYHWTYSLQSEAHDCCIVTKDAAYSAVSNHNHKIRVLGVESNTTSGYIILLYFTRCR
jgi:hypothetical protein